MRNQLWTLLNKDLLFIFKNKFHLMTLASLIVYVLYINFVFVSTDVATDTVYLVGNEQVLLNENDSAIQITAQSVAEVIKQNPDSIVVYQDGQKRSILIGDSGHSTLNNYKLLYANYLLTDIKRGLANTVRLDDRPKSVTKKREILSVIIFFEITTISFLGIAALFFKEKQMGILHVHAILPLNKSIYLMSKIVVFVSCELLFVFLINLFTLGLVDALTMSVRVSTATAILATIMVLLGFILSLLYNGFKDFVFAYLAIIIAMSSPVFLFVNTPLNWHGIVYFPTYHLYLAVRSAYLEQFYFSISYYAVSLLFIAILYIFAINLMQYKLKRV